MKLKDLLTGRDKLRKYDELKKWKERFANMVDIPTWNCLMAIPRSDKIVALPLPANIKQIIIDAIAAEIKKMEEENMGDKDSPLNGLFDGMKIGRIKTIRLWKQSK